MKRQILVPLDGSARADAILPHAAALARATGSTVTLLQIVAVEQAHAFLTDVALVQAPTHDRLERALVSLAEQTLEHHANALRKVNIATECEVVIAEDPAPAILSRADPAHTLAIAMATHGAGDAARLPHGSTSGHIIGNAQTPLLILPTARPSRQASDVSYRTVLMLVDEDDFAERDLTPLWTIAREIDGTMVLSTARNPDHPHADAFLTDSLAEAARLLASEGATVRKRILTGSADDLARSVCEEERADLLALTLHPGRERRWFSGIANDVLRRTGLPALLVPIPDRERVAEIGGSETTGWRLVPQAA